MSDGATTPETELLAKALALAKRINDKAADLLRPLELEMKIMGWVPQYRAVMWEAVMIAARERMEAADE